MNQAIGMKIKSVDSLDGNLVLTKHEKTCPRNEQILVCYTYEIWLSSPVPETN